MPYLYANFLEESKRTPVGLRIISQDVAKISLDRRAVPFK